MVLDAMMVIVQRDNSILPLGYCAMGVGAGQGSGERGHRIVGAGETAPMLAVMADFAVGVPPHFSIAISFAPRHPTKYR